MLILGAYYATACSALAALRAPRHHPGDRGGSRPRTRQRPAGNRGPPGTKITLTPSAPRDPPDLLISTVSCRRSRPYAQQIAARTLRPRSVVDIVYHPWPTPLATAARQAGAAVADGFDLLLHQAAGQFELMTGKPAPLEPMRTAGLAALAERR